MLVELSSEQVAIPKNRGKLLHEFMTRFLIREEPQIAPRVSPHYAPIAIAASIRDEIEEGSVTSGDGSRTVRTGDSRGAPSPAWVLWTSSLQLLGPSCCTTWGTIVLPSSTN